tara:strand:- start:1225 stop:2124 length:900 start_codon:yes stop_codon:yes gene_type:complete
MISKFRKIINSILKIFGLKIIFDEDYIKIQNEIKDLNDERINTEIYINNLMNQNITDSNFKDILSNIIQKENFEPVYIKSFKSILDKKKHLTFFDVGAHRGETIKEIKKYFPDAKLYSFEPFKESFDDLKEVSKLFNNSEVFNIGLSNFNGIEKLYNYIDNDNSYMSVINSTSKLLPGSMTKFGYKDPDKIIEIECEFSTLDKFITNKKIDFIDILKIDVQGNEYKVLEGADNIISSGGIKIIYLEILVFPFYEKQKDLSYYLSYFDDKKYELFGLYNLSYQNNSRILQFDAVFLKSDK